MKTELQTQVREIFREVWDVVNTDTVPNPDDLRLSNHAKDLSEATVLYADLDGSTTMVDTLHWQFSAEIYKAYLRCAARLIRYKGGEITAYDGDRIMAIFTGDSKNTSAVRTAFAIQWAVHNVIRPEIKAAYPTTNFVLNHAIGIDTSPLHAARIGVRGYNDLVWVGSAANHAAKLTTLPNGPLWITDSVFNNMHKSVKFSALSQTLMWTPMVWNAMNKRRIYKSNWSWGYD